jgi:hypothetical protein
MVASVLIAEGANMQAKEKDNVRITCRGVGHNVL